MNPDRSNRWVLASPTTAVFEHFMAVAVQGLGRLDTQLIEEDGRYSQLSSTEQNTIPEATRLTDRYTLSYLWVLGAYELVRTMSQRVREGAASVLGLDKELSDLKQRFERVRIPLAKMEPAKAHKHTDSSIAFPALHSKLVVSWQLAADVFVSRRELSDALLGFLEALRARDPKLAAK